MDGHLHCTLEDPAVAESGDHHLALQSANDTSSPSSASTSIPEMASAAILIITGLLFVFCGHRHFQPILFLAGFYVLGLFQIFV